MLNSLSRAAVVSVVLLVLATACSSPSSSQTTSSGSQSQGSTVASAQASSASRMALARHLKQIGAKFYGAYWCPYCAKQKELFGKEAFSQINYIECDPAGQNARTELCRAANIKGFPTWEINGKFYRGMQSLEDLADLSGYQGDRNFKN